MRHHTFSPRTYLIMATDSCDLEQLTIHGLHALAFGFGYKVGIVDYFLKTKLPCTAEDISQGLGLKLRYVQEWLSTMAAIKIVKVHEDGKFSLPYEPGTLRFCGVIAKCLQAFGDVWPELENAVKGTGPQGFGYTPKMIQLVDEFAGVQLQKEWFQNFLYPVFQLKAEGVHTVLDLGCGGGRITRHLATMYPKCSFHGVDIDQGSIDRARRELINSGLTNVQYSCIDGGKLPQEWTEKFDFVFLISVLHDACDVDAILDDVKRVLKQDGYCTATDPCVSSNTKDLIDDANAKFQMPFSLFSCLPRSLMEPSYVGYGIGWGYQRKKATIENHGFHVVQVGNIDVNTVQERVVFTK